MLGYLLDAVQVRPLQQRMLADDESIVLEEVVVNSATAAPPATSVLQFGGTYLRARTIPKKASPRTFRHYRLYSI